MVKSQIKDLIKHKHSKLDISGHKLTSIPKEIKKSLDKKTLSILELDLSFNLLKSSVLNEELNQMSNDFSGLTVLSLAANPIGDSFKFISSSIIQWKTVAELNLSGCKLTTLENNTFTPLVSLRKLTLANNYIKSPQDLCFSPCKSTLEELYLNGNTNLTSLPSSLYECKFLEILDLMGCGLETSAFTEKIGLITGLLEMNLGNNKLTRLTNAIGKCKRLCVLNLQDNFLNDLPISIGICIGLGQTSNGINLYGNPWGKNTELASRQSKGPLEIMDYLEKRLNFTNGPVKLDDNDQVDEPKKHLSPQAPVYYHENKPNSPSVENRPPHYNNLNQHRPPEYQEPINIPGPRNDNPNSIDLLKSEFKSTIQTYYEQTTHNQNNITKLIEIGNVLTNMQEKLDTMFHQVGIYKDFSYNSPIPTPKDAKNIQLFKINCLKLEKLAFSSKHTLDYIDSLTTHLKQRRLSSVEFDLKIAHIFSFLSLVFPKLC
ncbi:hypothetical protein CYY_009539 [Polysphondylium violaceum]|uniref:Leucine-rich repeat-containing protein n=1 Tax=Polysphondylium violaceum TaxID=133409 RepID=A0A8J4PLC3_9MYCE|nr:hypothetical protein CYY_009539 [Polysphondylium violaceum]